MMTHTARREETDKGDDECNEAASKEARPPRRDQNAPGHGTQEARDTALNNKQPLLHQPPLLSEPQRIG
jgi:hypothetical protein